jgi:hypothetical protein
MRTTQTLLESTDPRLIRIAGTVRRMAISLTSKVLWQLVGFRQLDGSIEVTNAEAFTGIGFYARPPRSAAPEAIVVSIVDATTPMIIAVRDEQTRANIAGGIEEDETAVFNSQAMLLLRRDGTIEVGAGPGIEPTVKGTTYRSAEDAMLTAVSTAIALIARIPGLTALEQAAVTTATAAIASFKNGGAGHLTTIVKVR